MGTIINNVIGSRGVHGHNDPVAVKRFLYEYGTDKDEIVYIECTDMSGKPTVDVCVTLATDPSERANLFYLISAEGADDLKRLGEEHTVTYADILFKFKSAPSNLEE
ncbi:hypothetical protein HK096_004577 [Nowakowskiella sp. JEL0078]|nr:hypothetical protein HK096_004577 [Nowakowskiella sp. JEL0078]